MDARVLRERLAVALLALLPFHAFLVTALTRTVAGPGHAPLGVIAIWKEAFFVLIVLIAFGEIAWKRLRHRYWIEFDAVDGFIVLLGVMAVLVGIRMQALLSPPFLLGARYDLFLPFMFLVLRRVAWSDAFRRQAVGALMISGAAVAVIGVAFLFLPVSALQTLGYSDLHSLYQSGGPLAPFQLIGDTGIRRMQSVMSGPNQLGLWMLVPLAAALMGPVQRSWKTLAVAALALLAIALSFSRAAWIAAAFVVLVALWQGTRGALRIRLMAAVGVGVVVVVGLLLALRPEVLLRATSNSRHIERPLEAMRIIRKHPLGLSLGSAGPAANHHSDTCVELPEGSDASWAKDRPELCVFVGDAQVQPTTKTCACPLLPENWFLQIGVELGVIGMLLYLLLTGRLLFLTAKKPFLFAVFGGLCIAGLFLHSFEDFGVSATLWVLLAAFL